MDFRDKIDSKGLKHVWVAEKIGVSKTMLSLYLSGERSLSPEKKILLEEVLA